MKLRGVIGPGKGYDSNSRKWPSELDELLGYRPFPGTLNVRFQAPLSEEEFRSFSGIVQPFPDFVCAPCRINGVFGHMCFSQNRKEPEVSTVYVISDRSLREYLRLKDRGWVEITSNSN